jgi:hypothetical protein
VIDVATLLTCAIPMAWDQLRVIRRNTHARLAHYGDAVGSVCAMAAVELVENAIKYGEQVDGLANGSFDLDDREGQIRITVRSGCCRRDHVEEIARRLRSIREVPDRGELFRARAMELLMDPQQTGGLGLYRVAFEGGFDLEYEYDEHRLTMIATRRAG